MNIRRLLLDVDKAIARPTILEIAGAVASCSGVEGLNVTVGEIDMETVGMDITIEGANLDYEEIVGAIEATGAVVHSVDQVIVGSRIVEGITRVR